MMAHKPFSCLILLKINIASLFLSQIFQTCLQAVNELVDLPKASLATELQQTATAFNLRFIRRNQK